MNQPTSITFLEVDHISNCERSRSEITTFLLNPSPLLSTAEATGNAVTDNFLLAVGDRLSRQLPTPLVQLLIGQLRPDGTGTESVDLLVGVRDVANEVITGGNKGNRVINHGKKIPATKGSVKTFFKLFFGQGLREPSGHPIRQTKPPIRDPGRFWHGLNRLFLVRFRKKTVILFPIVCKGNLDLCKVGSIRNPSKVRQLLYKTTTVL